MIIQIMSLTTVLKPITSPTSLKQPQLIHATPHQIRKGCNGKNNQQKTYDYCCKSGTNACKKKYPADEFNPWKDKSQCIYSPVRNHIIGGNGVRKQFRVLYLIYASIDKESPNIEPKNKRKVSVRKNCFDKKYRFRRDRCCII